MASDFEDNRLESEPGDFSCFVIDAGPVVDTDEGFVSGGLNSIVASKTLLLLSKRNKPDSNEKNKARCSKTDAMKYTWD